MFSESSDDEDSSEKVNKEVEKLDEEAEVLNIFVLSLLILRVKGWNLIILIFLIYL